MNDIDRSVKRSIPVLEFFERAKDVFQIDRVSPDAVLLKHSLDSPRLQKLGLALSGFADRVHRGRIQIFGNSERSYLKRFEREGRLAAYARLDRHNISCIVSTAAPEPDVELVDFTRTNEIPLLATPIPSSEAISSIAHILENALAPEMTIHGVLVEVFGCGVILLGESGIGKSECALDLIGRGHRLISDDMVVIRRIGEKLIGASPELTRDHLEIRGLGILNARQLFGVSALSDTSQVRLCIAFSDLTKEPQKERLSFSAASFAALGMSIPKFDIPVSYGRNLATLTEAAVRVFVSQGSENTAMEELIANHDRAIANSVTI